MTGPDPDTDTDTGTDPKTGADPKAGGGVRTVSARSGEYVVIRALLRPVWRTLPRGPLAACGGLGLLLAGIPRLLPGRPDPWLCLNLLRGAALVLAVGLAFLLDDPARHTTAPVPARRPLRSGLRMALVAPAAALWWAVALLLVPEPARPPAGALTLEAAAIAATALAAASAAVRFTDRAEPGPGVATGLLVTAMTVPTLLLPERWSLVVSVNDPHWDAAHERWAVVLAVAALICAVCCTEPVRTWRRTVPARR
ncbi:ABC transporter [Streptomyces sp. NPDC059668]|uniref:ABC transporter n=1 Tax=Streptomyces sp. NPDC059668 TaxID=3346900 RepID=UPI00367E3769